jgi:hypothetical protein
MTPAEVPPTIIVSVVQAPMLMGLFWMLHGIRRELDRRIERGDLRQSDGLARTREELAHFKLEGARTYVPLSLIRSLDQRVTEHLNRIEATLEEATRR